jgi:hypothetical protein
MAFNSREYEWADLTLMLGGSDITGIQGVKYAEKADREAIFGKGRFAHSIQTGNVTYEGEITMLQSEYQALVAASANKSILSLALDAEVSYGNPPDPIITDRIIGLRFTEAPKEFKQGDKFMPITLPFIALRVENNV